MAAIDHTTMVWKNGEYMADQNQCPFTYTRDGLIVDIDGIGDIRGKIKWIRNEGYALYERAGNDELCCGSLNPSFLWWSVTSFLKWKLHIMKRFCYLREVGVYENGAIELYIWHDPIKRTYASFYFDGTNTYIVLGGYGHWENVYCHFMNRGYGEEFEKKMLSEAYQWLSDKVLEEIAEYMTDDWDEQEEALERLRAVFLKENDLCSPCIC